MFGADGCSEAGWISRGNRNVSFYLRLVSEENVDTFSLFHAQPNAAKPIRQLRAVQVDDDRNRSGIFLKVSHVIATSVEQLVSD